MYNYLYKCGRCNVVVSHRAYIGRQGIIKCEMCKDINMHYQIVNDGGKFYSYEDEE